MPPCRVPRSARGRHARRALSRRCLELRKLTVRVRSTVPSLPWSIVIVAVPLAIVTVTMFSGRVIVQAPAVGLPSGP
jgi:hypothetical protein